jgi:enoyl-[acyl-carrier protein] reductase I
MGTSLYDWSSRLLEQKLFSENARIISFTSEGNSRVFERYGAVSASKSVLESISRQMAVEYAPFGINVNCIQAGVTDTRSLRMIPGSERLKEIALRRNPKKRLTTPKDVANAVYLLCRPEANWINGTTLVVDGGEHLH